MTTEKTRPRILWKGTCPRSGIVDAATTLFRCVATEPSLGSSLPAGHEELRVEQWAPDAMGKYCWTPVGFTPLRWFVLEEAVLSGPQIAEEAEYIPPGHGG